MSSRAKLLKIPQIPFRRNARDESDDSEEEGEEDEEDNDDDTDSQDSNFIIPSALGLNHIRTRSAPSPLRFSSSDAATLSLTDDSNMVKCAVEPKAKLTLIEQGNRASSITFFFLRKNLLFNIKI